MAEFLYRLLSLSLAGGILTLLAAGLNALLRGRVPHRFCYGLWLLVLARFLLPVGWGGGVLGAAMSCLPASEIHTGPQQPSAGPELVLTIGAGAQAQGAAPRDPGWAGPGAILWLTGAALVLGYSGMGYCRFCRNLEREAMPADPKEMELLSQLDDGKRRLPKLLRSGAAVSPVLVGVLRPKIYLPLDPLPEHALEGVLRHELTHWRRRDLLCKWWLWAVTGLHWFNPAVWLLRRGMERDCELSCDEAVAAPLPKRQRLTYGQALLWAAEREAGAGLLSAPLWSQKQRLTERLNTIMKPIHTSLKARCLFTGAVAVLVMAAAVLGVYAGQTSGGQEGGTLAGQGALSASQLVPPETLDWPFQAGGEIALTGLFGTRVHPITGTTTSHDGIDIRLDAGQPVLAAADGVVAQAGFDPEDGQFIVVEHGGGLTTAYCNLSSGSAVQAGQQVEAGEQIGAVGSTGSSTGSHLHFEVTRDGTLIDPLSLLPYRGPGAE